MAIIPNERSLTITLCQSTKFWISYLRCYKILSNLKINHCPK